MIEEKEQIYWLYPSSINWEHQSNNIYSEIELLCLYNSLYNLENRALKFNASTAEFTKVQQHFKQLGNSLWEPGNVTFYQNNPSHLIGTKIPEEYSSLLLIASSDINDFEQILNLLDIKWQFLMKKSKVIIR